MEDNNTNLFAEEVKTKEVEAEVEPKEEKPKENKPLQKVMAYLNKLVEDGDEQLREGMANTPLKSEEKMWDYIRRQARKEAENGFACIDDPVVYGWAVHYYTEVSEEVDGPKEKPKVAPVYTPATTYSKGKAKKAEPKEEEPNLFSGLL